MWNILDTIATTEIKDPMTTLLVAIIEYLAYRFIKIKHGINLNAWRGIHPKGRARYQQVIPNENTPYINQVVHATDALSCADYTLAQAGNSLAHKITLAKRGVEVDGWYKNRVKHIHLRHIKPKWMWPILIMGAAIIFKSHLLAKTLHTRSAYICTCPQLHHNSQSYR